MKTWKKILILCVIGFILGIIVENIWASNNFIWNIGKFMIFVSIATSVISIIVGMVTSYKENGKLPLWSYIVISVVIAFIVIAILGNQFTNEFNNDSKYYSEEFYNNSNTQSNIQDKVYYLQIENFNIPIPQGFYYVGGERDTGIVISDNKNDIRKGVNSELLGNQFVWIPTSIDQFIRQDWNKQGIEYERTIENETEEFAKLKESIKKYNGFYVARYEASYGFDKISSKKSNNIVVHYNYGMGKLPNGTLLNKILYGEAVDLSLEMYEDSCSVNSHLIYGTEWDRIIQWLLENNISKDIILNDSGTIGNYAEINNTDRKYTSEVNNTGINTKFCTNNIYDMAGNLAEWTQEKAIYSGNIIRGGSCMENGNVAPMCYRSHSDSGQSIYTRLAYVGFRVALYIK